MNYFQNVSSCHQGVQAPEIPPHSMVLEANVHTTKIEVGLSTLESLTQTRISDARLTIA